MHQLSDTKLLIAYYNAVDLSLDKDFIVLLETEIKSRKSIKKRLRDDSQ